MAQATSKNRERGKFLTCMLVIGAIGLFLALRDIPSISPSDWLSILRSISFVVTFAELYGIWVWKKWGIYLLIVQYVINLLLLPNVAYSITKNASMSVAVATLSFTILTLYFAIWFWALYRKWQYFE